MGEAACIPGECACMCGDWTAVGEQTPIGELVCENGELTLTGEETDPTGECAWMGDSMLGDSGWGHVF